MGGSTEYVFFFGSFSNYFPNLSPLHTLNKCASVMLFKEKNLYKITTITFCFSTVTGKLFAFSRMSAMDGVETLFEEKFIS